MAYESREELADAGSDVAGLNAVEGREVEVGGEEGVVGGHRSGGEGGAGGGGGAFPRAEGAERGGGREGGEEEEAGGDGEWEPRGERKEKHGGGGDVDVLLTSAGAGVGHLASRGLAGLPKGSDPSIQ